MTPLHNQHDDKKWHVIYVHARHEKRIHEDMLKMQLESFLPMKKDLHEWSDRKKWVEVPLFSSYVFVRLSVGRSAGEVPGAKPAPNEKGGIYLLDGFVKFVSTNGKACTVPEWQIDGIKRMIDSYPDQVEVLDSDYIGMEGAILAGPLAGLHGKIIEVKNRKCFAIKVDGIDRVLSVTIPVSLFKPTPSQMESGKSEQAGQMSRGNLKRVV